MMMREGLFSTLLIIHLYPCPSQGKAGYYIFYLRVRLVLGAGAFLTIS